MEGQKRKRWRKGVATDRPPFYLGQRASGYLGYREREGKKLKWMSVTIIEGREKSKKKMILCDGVNTAWKMGG